MEAKNFPGCCAITVVTELDCLGAEDEWSKNKAKDLDEIAKIEDPENDYDGLATRTASVLVLTNKDRGGYKRAAAFLRKHGWKCLGRCPGAHEYSGNRYKCYLWGSEEFEKAVRDR